MDKKEAQERLEQARKEKTITWDAKESNKTLGQLTSNDIATSLENIKKLHDERPRPSCRACNEELESYTSVLCDACNEKQEQAFKQEQQEKEAAQYQDRLKNIDKWVLSIGIGERYKVCALDTFKGGEKYVKECREFVKSQNYSMFLTGEYGCGKTHLAVGICRELLKIEKVPSIIFTTGAEMLLNIRKSFSSEEITEDEIISKYSSPDFLVIDDLGAEKTTEWAKTTLYVIIDRRDRGMMPTVITSNLSLMKIEESLGGRIASRISNSRIVNVLMKDYRRMRKANRELRKGER